MPQISTIGTGGTYTTIAAWAAAEGGQDYGLGNPAIGEFLGLLNENVAVTGVFVRGYILRAASGLELDKSNLSTAVGNSSDLRPNISTSGAVAEHRNIEINSSNTGVTTDLVYKDCVMYENFSATTKNVTMRETVHVGMSRALDAASGNANAIAINCTAIDNTGTFSYVRFLCTNCITIGSAGFAATVSGSDYNASTDTTAPGANSLINRTTADLVNYASGDYRTASTSSLSTAGDGGTYIGFGLETSSGITVTVNETGPSFTESIDTNLSVNITGNITESGPSFAESISATLSALTIQAVITESGPTFNESISANVTTSLTINVSIAEQGPSFTESISTNLDTNLSATINELGPGFTESINVSTTTEISATITEFGPRFSENIVTSIPIKISLNPRNSVKVKRKSNAVKIKRKSNNIRVK